MIIDSWSLGLGGGSGDINKVLWGKHGYHGHRRDKKKKMLFFMHVATITLIFIIDQSENVNRPN